MTVQMKATEQYFAVVLFIMLHKVVLTFESVTAGLCVSQLGSLRRHLVSGTRIGGL